MNPERWQRIQALFEQCLEQAPENRSTYLETESKGDTALVQEVLSLLEHMDPASAFFEELEEEVSHAFEVESSLLPLGTEIAAYVVEEEIARGGMSVVYLGQRQKGDFQQQVAIKVMKQGLDSPELLRRFQHERQILAQLKHPYIAQIYDGGRLEQGLPYFILEYVEGESVTEYAKQKLPDLNDKLELFLKIARTVQFAHQNLIVHRDIKPSNILITAEGEPKLLDFGIAKMLTEGELSHGAMQTQQHKRVFTLEYAAPEQIKGEAITASTDVYQLGLLLYELLTGERCFQFKEESFRERENLILHQLPKAPSQRIAQARVKAKVKGELDNIILYCLRKEPEKRYENVESLFRDIQAFLRNEPISLKDKDWRYRSQKFIQRNRPLLLVSLLAVLFLIGGIISTSYQAYQTSQALKEERRARAKESAVSSFLTYLISREDPYGQKSSLLTDTLSAPKSLENTLDEVVPRFISEFKNDPVFTIENLYLCADFYVKLEKHKKAVNVYRQLYFLCVDETDCKPEDKVFFLQRWGMQLFAQGQFKQADSLLIAALAYLEEIPETDIHKARKSLVLIDRADLFSYIGKLPKADSLFQAGFDLYQSIPSSLYNGYYSFSKDDVYLTWSRTKGQMGQHEEAIRLGDSAYRFHSSSIGVEHFSNSPFLYQIGMNYMYLQQWDSSEKFLRAGIALYEDNQKEGDWALSALMNDLANVLGGKQQYEEQEQLLHETLALKRKIFGIKHIYNAPTWLSLGHSSLFQKKYESAEEAYQTALSINKSKLPTGHQNTAACYLALARLYTTTERFREAENIARQGLVEVENTLPDDHRVVGFGKMFLAQALLEQGKYQEASPYFDQSLQVMEKLGLTENIAEIHTAQERIAQAKASS